MADGWEGFAIRTASDQLDRCVLYNRAIDRLSASPYNMLGLYRDVAGGVGLMLFYQPGELARGDDVAVAVAIDQREPIILSGAAHSDFHLITRPMSEPAIAALRQATSIDATTQGRHIRFAVSGLAATLDRLEACIAAHGQ
ncbi:MAG: hypothetical protein HY056_02825 [Proteobacteria bacterium]|nr:hypothetical protein [Pseudomonadota bacterium]